MWMHHISLEASLQKPQIRPNHQPCTPTDPLTQDPAEKSISSQKKFQNLVFYNISLFDCNSLDAQTSALHVKTRQRKRRRPEQLASGGSCRLGSHNDIIKIVLVLLSHLHWLKADRRCPSGTNLTWYLEKRKHALALLGYDGLRA